jgi:hypothetical protein
LALSMVVLALAGLLLQGLAEARELDLGFSTSTSLFLTLEKPGPGEPVEAARVEALVQELSAAAGVRKVALASRVPLSFTDVQAEEVQLPEAGRKAEESSVMSLVTAVGPGYLEALEMPLLGGRALGTAEAPRSAIVNRELAGRLWPGKDPVGREFRIKSDPGSPHTVVGWIENSRYITPWESPRPAYLVPWEPSARLCLMVRTSLPPDDVLVSLRRVLGESVPSLRLVSAVRGEELVDRSLWALRLVATLLAAFGLLVVVLAGVGVYGVVANSVGQRERELGVRLSLGARRGELVWAVLRSESGFVIWGLMAGLALTVAAKGLVGRLLFGAGEEEVWVLGSVVVFLLAMALLAQGVTVARILRQPPTRLLRGREV